MTELEEKFYKVFGIGKREFCDCNSDGFCPTYHSEVCDNSCEHWIKNIRYPKINDHILLELVCILAKHQYRMWLLPYCIDANLNKNDLKIKILTDIINLSYSNECKSDVRKLFEE